MHQQQETSTWAAAGRVVRTALLVLTVLITASAAPADESSLKGLYDRARARIVAGEFSGALELLRDVSPGQGPRRILTSPASGPCLTIPDPASDSSLICVGSNWAGRFNPAATADGFTSLTPFPDRLLRIFQDLQVELQPRSAAMTGNRLIVDFFRHSQLTGGRYGLLAGISTATLAVDWVYDHDDAYTAWAAGARMLAIASSESQAVIGLSLTNGAVIWENSELLSTWSTMVAAPDIIVAGNLDTMAAFDETSGRLLWQTNVPADSMLVTGDRLIVASSAQGVSALRTSSGERLWHRPADSPDEPTVLTVLDDSVLAVSDSTIRYLDIATGAVRSTLNIQGSCEVHAVTAGTNLIYLRTDAGYVCLDGEGKLLHQMASPDHIVRRSDHEVRQGLVLWQDRYVIDTSSGRILNAVDQVTVDDLLELQAACRVIMKEGNPSRSLAAIGRGFGAMLPAVLRAQAGDDSARRHALYMANMDRAMPGARLELLTELRENAGLLWCRPLHDYGLMAAAGGYDLFRSLPDRIEICDWRSGRKLRAIPHQARLGRPLVTNEGTRMTTIDNMTSLVTCRDPRTGLVLWEKDLDVLPVPLDVASDEEALPVQAAPLPGTNRAEVIMLVGGPDMRGIAMRPDDGSVLWHTELDPIRHFYNDWWVRSARGTYLAMSHDSLQRRSGMVLHGIDVRNGRKRWRRHLSYRNQICGLGAGYVAWIARPYQSQDGWQGMVSVMEIETGRIVWNQVVTRGQHASLSEDRLILTKSDDGRTAVKIVEIQTGTVFMDSSFPDDEVAAPYISIKAGMVFLGSAVVGAEHEVTRRCGPVLVFDLRTGRELGRIPAPPYVVEVKDGVLVGNDSYSGYIWALDWNRALQGLETAHTAESDPREPAGREKAKVAP